MADRSPGRPAALRLTRSAEGEASPRFLPDGSLLFTSRRPDPEAGQAPRDGAAADVGALWLLPPGGGEARVVAALPGGITAAEVAAGTGAVVVSSPVLPVRPSDSTAADDARLRKERDDAGVTAILHESAPVRFWDHDLGPDQVRLFLVGPDRLIEAERLRTPAGTEDPGPFSGMRDLTPEPGRALDEETFELSPDGGLGADRLVAMGSRRAVARRAGGHRRGQREAPGAAQRAGVQLRGSPRLARRPAHRACQRETQNTAELPPDVTLVPLAVNGAGAAGGNRAATCCPAWTGGLREAAWSRDSAAVYFAADDAGRRPVFRADASDRRGQAGDRRRRCVHRPEPVAGRTVPVRPAVGGGLAAHPGAHRTGRGRGRPGPAGGAGRAADRAGPGGGGAGGRRRRPADPVLAGAARRRVGRQPGAAAAVGARRPHEQLERLVVAVEPVADGRPRLRRAAAGPGAVHRLRPAVHRPGLPRWGERPFGDIMAATEPALARPDIDAERVGMMGGSYGGYMANWMAGHTERFQAIVSHAGLWALDQMFGTTDHPMFWRPQFGDPLTQPEMYEANSPHRHIEKIRTPMLVIHGNKDYRVPVSEALRLWWDLSRYGMEAKFLYFPDENHWILTPGNARIWYETVLAFLAQHVLGQPWQRPALL